MLKLPAIFIRSAALILVLTGVAKIGSALFADGGKAVFASPEPITGVSFRMLFWVVGSCELLVAFLCFFSRTVVAGWLLAVLSVNLLVYRLGVWYLGYRTPCSCLGTLTDFIHMPPSLADNIMKALLGYMLVGSLALLAFGGRREKMEAAATTQK